MSATKQVYSEYFSKEEYEKELSKSLELGCVEHALLFYHFSQYCILRNEDFISTEKYYELCDFLADNLQELPKALQEYVVFDDLFTYDCKLEIAPSQEAFQKGKHLIYNIGAMLERLEERIDIDFNLKVVDELDSVD
jgi:hypothetical protein